MPGERLTLQGPFLLCISEFQIFQGPPFLPPSAYIKYSRNKYEKWARKKKQTNKSRDRKLEPRRKLLQYIYPINWGSTLLDLLNQQLTLNDSATKVEKDQLLRRGTTWAWWGLVLQALQASAGSLALLSKFLYGPLPLSHIIEPRPEEAG